MPASAISALISAFIAPSALRFMHGHSTRPATGSHTRPITFFSAIAAALRHLSALPPSSSHSAAAAIAAAEPVSAWQPCSAPLMLAFAAIMLPIAPAVSRPLSSFSSFQPRSFAQVKSTPGNIPLAPAVGAATMRPIAAFTSTTAMLAAAALAASVPLSAFFSARSFRRIASPPERPDTLSSSSVSPSSTLRLMACSVVLSSFNMFSAVSSESSCWRRSITSLIVSPSFLQMAISSSPFVKQ